MSHVITGLTNGTSYTFTVTATNAVGISSSSAASNAVVPKVPDTVPGAPTSVQAVAGNTQATVTFAEPASNGGTVITGYTVTSLPTGGVDTNAGSTSLSHVITGLEDGISYTFIVTATNAVGTGGASVASNQITPVDTSNPILSFITATPTDTNSTITWTTNELASSIVDYGLTNSYGTSTTETNTSPRVLNHSVSLPSLVACATYHYRVRSTDGSTNTVTSNDNTFTTTGCTGSATVNSQAASNVSSATGGVTNLISGGTEIDLDIPAGATEIDAVFQIKSLDQTSVLGTSGSPIGVNVVGNYVFDLKALTDTGTTVTAFLEPITITLTYQDSDVMSIDENSLVIYRWNGSIWNALSNCVVNTNLNTVTCNTSNFSVFGVFGTEVPSDSSNILSGSSHRVTKASVKSRVKKLLVAGKKTEALKLVQKYPRYFPEYVAMSKTTPTSNTSMYNSAPSSPDCLLPPALILTDFKDYLVCKNLITHRTKAEEYGYQRYLARKELLGVGTSMFLAHSQSPLDHMKDMSSYHSPYFLDVGLSSHPSWILQTVENGIKLNLISTNNSLFRPDNHATRAETFSVLMKSVCMNVPQDPAFSWERSVYNVAKDNGITTKSWDEFFPESPIIRQDFFVVATRLNIWAEATG